VAIWDAPRCVVIVLDEVVGTQRWARHSPGSRRIVWTEQAGDARLLGLLETPRPRAWHHPDPEVVDEELVDMATKRVKPCQVATERSSSAW